VSQRSGVPQPRSLTFSGRLPGSRLGRAVQALFEQTGASSRGDPPLRGSAHRLPQPVRRRPARQRRAGAAAGRDTDLDGIDDNALLLCTILREPTFPDLADELWSAITANAYERFTAGLRATVDAGVVRIADPEATAAVLAASLAHYPLVGLLIGHTPGGIDRDRYREAWIEHAQAVLRRAADASRTTPGNDSST